MNPLNFAYLFAAGGFGGSSKHLSGPWFSLRGPLYHIILKAHLIPLPPCWSFSSRSFLRSKFALGSACCHQEMDEGAGVSGKLGCNGLALSRFFPSSAAEAQVREVWCVPCSKKGTLFAGHPLGPVLWVSPGLSLGLSLPSAVSLEGLGWCYREALYCEAGFSLRSFIFAAITLI